MATTAESTPRRKRVVLPLLFLLLLVVIVGLVVAAAVRGEWVDVVEKNPLSPDEGAVTQLYQKPNGNVVVRCAVLIDAPPKNVWAAVRAHHEFPPDVGDVEATPQRDGRILVAGVIHSRLGIDWAFESLVKHSESADKGEFSASWTERDVGAFKLNRGSWSVTATDKSQRQSLLVCTLQIEMKNGPNFIVRDALLYRLPEVVKAMRDACLRKHS